MGAIVGLGMTDNKTSGRNRKQLAMLGGVENVTVPEFSIRALRDDLKLRGDLSREQRLALLGLAEQLVEALTEPDELDR